MLLSRALISGLLFVRATAFDDDLLVVAEGAGQLVTEVEIGWRVFALGPRRV